MSGKATTTDTTTARPCVGVLDIGSNSVRLVVYEAGRRLPVPLYNDKDVCALGRGLDRTGRLDPEGVAMAHETLARLAGLARAMGVERLDALATAAIREAADGPGFVAEVERRHGIVIQVVDGADEARLAAEGVLCGVPDADGLVADLGGGSLDLVETTPQAYGDWASLPLGVLRLVERSGERPGLVRTLMDDSLAELDWLDRLHGRSVHAVGGAWRSTARVCIELLRYPLHVLDSFTLESGEALGLLREITRMDPAAIEAIDGVSKRRAPQVPYAAAALERLVAAAMPGRLVFSIFGMREGWYHANLDAAVRDEDPLISLCRRHEETWGRFPGAGAEMATWSDGLFPGETPAQRRLRHAVCHVADAFWHEHPDYRAEQAFLRVLRLPFMGLDHRDRACLALAVHVRYQGDPKADFARRARELLDDSRVRRATLVGHALRLGYTVSGGVPGLLGRTRIQLSGDQLVLSVPEDERIFLTGQVERRLEKLAKVVGCDSAVETMPAAE